MTKVLHIEIDKDCTSCPYYRYNGNYGMSYNSGWDCEHDGKLDHRRIVDDNHSYPVPIPEDCPLPNKE